MNRIHSEPRLPRSGNAALAAGALIQAALGAVFVVAGLSKVVAPNYSQQFRTFVLGSEGSSSGPLSMVVQVMVVPNLDVVANLARFTELVGMSPGVYRRQAARATAGMPSCVAKQVTRPIRNREAPVTEPPLD